MNGAVYISFFQGQLESVLEQVVQLAVQEISQTVGSSLNSLLLETAAKEQENRQLKLQLQTRESCGRTGTRPAEGGGSASGKKAGEELAPPERRLPPPQQPRPRAPTDTRRLQQRGRIVGTLHNIHDTTQHKHARETQTRASCITDTEARNCHIWLCALTSAPKLQSRFTGTRRASENKGEAPSHEQARPPGGGGAGAGAGAPAPGPSAQGRAPRQIYSHRAGLCLRGRLASGGHLAGGGNASTQSPCGPAGEAMKSPMKDSPLDQDQSKGL